MVKQMLLKNIHIPSLTFDVELAPETAKLVFLEQLESQILLAFQPWGIWIGNISSGK